MSAPILAWEVELDRPFGRRARREVLLPIRRTKLTKKCVSFMGNHEVFE